MLTTLPTLKLRLALPSGDTTFDALLTSAITAVSSRFDRETNRTLARTENATHEFDPLDTEILVPCYPIESVQKFELKQNETEGWLEQPNVQYLRAMKASRRTSLLALAAVALLIAGVGSLWWAKDAQRKFEQTRLALHRQGFKLEVSEFKLTASPEVTARAAALDEAGKACYLRLAEAINYLPPVGTNAALVLWNQPEVFADSSTNLWADLRTQLNQISLDQACTAALSGPYRSRFATERDGGIALVGGNACRLPDPLAARTLLALHDQDQGRAWTNLLALTRLVAGWQYQPFDRDFLYWRDVNLDRAYGVTWQALQAGGWTELQLAALQGEWQTANFRGGLADMAAFTRADTQLAYARQGRQPLPPFPLTLLLSPRYAWQRLTQRAAVAQYRNTERFQDEEALLRLFSDCEEDYRIVQGCPTWQNIKSMPRLWKQPPGVTTLIALATNFNSRSERSAILAHLHSRYRFGFQPRIEGQLWRLADAEARRRLLVVALALERYRLRRGCSPESLDALPPDLLASPPVDFLDGKPLRYRRSEDGRFTLYSVGLDFQDDGGNSRQPGMLWASSGRDKTDLVWPRPASAPELAAEISERRQLPWTQTARTTFVPGK
jgi:hypothetical protein